MIAIPSAAIGTLTQKITRQSISISAPPASGPIASATAETAAQIPSALACSALPGKTLQMIASERVSIGAAPTPWTTRPAISISGPLAAPERTEPAAKITIPTGTPACDDMSPSRPALITRIAIVNRYPFIIHCRASGVAPRSRWMTGSASATTVESSIKRNRPAQAPARVHHLRLSSAIAISGDAIARGGWPRP